MTAPDLPAMCDPRPRGRWATAGMMLNAAASLWLLMYAVTSPQHRTQYKLVSDPDFWGALGIVLLANIAGAVTFLMWLWRAYGNLPALGAQQLRLRRGWAIGGWFIPIAGYVLGLFVLADLDRGSDPDVPAIRKERWWKERPIGVLVWCWLGTYVVGQLAFNDAFSSITGRQGVEPRSGDTFNEAMRRMFDLPLNQSFWTMLPLAAALLAVAAICAAVLVQRISSRQVERFSRHGDAIQAATPQSSPAHTFGATSMPAANMASASTAPSPLAGNVLQDVPVAAPPQLLEAPQRDPDETHAGQIEEGVEGGLWLPVPHLCDMFLQVTSQDGTALQVEVADEQREWIPVPRIEEPSYTTKLHVAETTQRFVRVVDPTGGERAWTMRIWFEAPAAL